MWESNHTVNPRIDFVGSNFARLYVNMKPSTPPIPLHFLVPGFSKCGTTTLCDLLAEHPQLFMPTGKSKEPRFFDKSDFDQRWSDYAEHFSAAHPGALLGEGSPNYSEVLGGVEASKRIIKLYPQIKLIFIARDPIARIESSYREFHHSGPKYGTSAPFGLGKAIEAAPQLLEDACFLTRISNYRDHLPSDQILVVFLEDLKSKPDMVLKQCFTFLGVDPAIRISNSQRQLNPGSLKLYDTLQLRDMRNCIWSPETGQALKKLDLDIQDQFLEKLGVRKRFTNTPLEWDDEGLDHVVQRLRNEIPLFLETFGKSRTFWKRFSESVHHVATRERLVSGATLQLKKDRGMGLEIQDHGNKNVVKGGPFTFHEHFPLVIKGNHNTISIEPGFEVQNNCKWVIHGNHNHVRIGSQVSFLESTILKIEGNQNQISIAASVCGNIHLHIQTNGATFQLGEHTSVIEGFFSLQEPYKLIIGRDCMISAGVWIVVSDMHAIRDVDTGERLNPGGDVIIDDHIWLGFRSIVLKGVHIGQGSVIGAGATVTHDIPEHCMAVGVPAKIIRERISWTRGLEEPSP